MAARCVQGQLAACVLAKQRFRTAVADAAQSAQVKISCKIEHDAARLLAQGDALWATRRAAEAASSGAVEQRIDAALGAGSAGVAGGRGAGMLLLVGIQQGHAVAFNMLDRLYK